MAFLQSTVVSGTLSASSYVYGDGSTLSNVNYSSSYTMDLTANCVRLGQGGGDISTNTALGQLTLNSNTTGIQNTAVGNCALLINTSGSYNTAVGEGSLRCNTTGLETQL